MQWLADNRTWVLLIGGMIGMHLFGHGHGGHGSGGGKPKDRQPDREENAR